MIAYLLLISVSLAYGRSISKYEENSDMIDSNCYIDNLLAKIRTSMSSLDPVSLKDSQYTNDKGHYAITDTIMTGLSTLYRTDDTETRIDGTDKIITVNLTALELIISSTLFVEESVYREHTYGKITGEMQAPDITMSIRITTGQPVLESFSCRNFALITNGRFTGNSTDNLEAILTEAVDFGFEVMFSYYANDIIRDDLRFFIDKIVEQSKYVSFKY